ncbi:MAG: UDP-N-acetylmuramoyl-L-alanine--D-glutamate ligase [Peptococcaceae bacterium]|nr:UDP-N-acetylmuramoyl-L-alanine--D-glutamate ligase [Peptococcaceae bacterium]
MALTVESLRGKRAAVMGIGLRSGVPLIRFLVDRGARVTACDQKTREQLHDALDALGERDVEYILGGEYLGRLEGFDLLFRTPVMRPDLPEIVKAVAKGALLTSETELVFDLAKAPIIAVTGSDGKTTTTSLIFAILSEAGYMTYLGGNIGQSLVEQVEDIPPSARIVLELSSFQLLPMTQSPAVAVVTNISPNHLDVHASYAEYISAKANIWRHQGSEDYVILNYDDLTTRAMAGHVPGKVVFFSRREAVPCGVFVRGSSLVARWQGAEVQICDITGLRLLGGHNIENVAAAAAVGLVQGVDPRIIASAVTSFTPVEHRLELVRELDGVRYYNDSIASSPTRTLAGLRAIGGDILLIAGGSDKNVPFDELALELVERVRAVALIGSTADKLAMAIKDAERKKGKKVKKINLPTLQAAVEWCRRQAEPGSSIMLSPACASFDMFRDFEDRGRKFKNIVKAL